MPHNISVLTFRVGNAKMGNGVHDTTFDLPEIWNGLQGPDHNNARTTSMVQLCNGAGNAVCCQKKNIV